ncbi:hypothetical protein ACWCQM_34560 [Streptomyces sp. NPDC002125]
MTENFYSQGTHSTFISKPVEHRRTRLGNAPTDSPSEWPAYRHDRWPASTNR